MDTDRAVRVARLLGVLVLVYALVRIPTSADTTAGGLAFLQFNMCGNACGTHLTVVADLKREIADHRPGPLVVTLQEVCRSQYDGHDNFAQEDRRPHAAPTTTFPLARPCSR